MFSLTDPDTGQVKSWVWIAGGIGVVAVIAIVAGKGSLSGGTGSSANGQSSDATDSLATLNDLINQLIQQNADNAAKNPPPKDPVKAKQPPHKKGYHMWYDEVKNIWHYVKTPNCSPGHIPAWASDGSHRLVCHKKPVKKDAQVSSAQAVSSEASYSKGVFGTAGTSNIHSSVGSQPALNPTSGK